MEKLIFPGAESYQYGSIQNDCFGEVAAIGLQLPQGRFLAVPRSSHCGNKRLLYMKQVPMFKLRITLPSLFWHLYFCSLAYWASLILKIASCYTATRIKQKIRSLTCLIQREICALSGTISSVAAICTSQILVNATKYNYLQVYLLVVDNFIGRLYHYTYLQPKPGKF